MNNLDFINLVKELRLAQKKYFKERTQSSLVAAKKLEAEVDKALDTLDEYLVWKANQGTQAELPLESAKED
jgi:hypothetical protein